MSISHIHCKNKLVVSSSCPVHLTTTIHWKPS